MKSNDDERVRLMEEVRQEVESLTQEERQQLLKDLQQMKNRRRRKALFDTKLFVEIL